MLTIRLQRIGKKSQPSYRLIISEKARATNSSVLEYLGHYHPATKDKTIVLEKERIEYWLSKGATTSNTVHNLLVKNGIIKDKKVKSFSIPTKIAKKKNEEAKKAADEKKKLDDQEAKKKAEEVKKEEEKKEEVKS
jgi:small subunit ribosomal protein S16